MVHGWDHVLRIEYLIVFLSSSVVNTVKLFSGCRSDFLRVVLFYHKLELLRNHVNRETFFFDKYILLLPIPCIFHTDAAPIIFNI